MSNREVVFVEGMRTAFGRMGGTLRDFTAEQLAGIGIKGLVEKTKIKEKGKVDCVFLGSAAHCSQMCISCRTPSVISVRWMVAVRLLHTWHCIGSRESSSCRAEIHRRSIYASAAEHRDFTIHTTPKPSVSISSISASEHKQVTPSPDGYYARTDAPVSLPGRSHW